MKENVDKIYWKYIVEINMWDKNDRHELQVTINKIESITLSGKRE